MGAPGFDDRSSGVLAYRDGSGPRKLLEQHNKCQLVIKSEICSCERLRRKLLRFRSDGRLRVEPSIACVILNSADTV